MDYKAVKLLPKGETTVANNKGVLIISGGSPFGGYLYLYNGDGTTYTFPQGSLSILVPAREAYIVGFKVAGWTGDSQAQVYELF